MYMQKSRSRAEVRQLECITARERTKVYTSNTVLTTIERTLLALTYSCAYGRLRVCFLHECSCKPQIFLKWVCDVIIILHAMTSGIEVNLDRHTQYWVRFIHADGTYTVDDVLIHLLIYYSNEEHSDDITPCLHNWPVVYSLKHSIHDINKILASTYV